MFDAPFSNHNDKSAPDQDPATMGSVVIAATKQALLFRYNYLPHLYSLMYDAHINGHTVLRPLFFEFPSDPMARKVETQFLWGSSFMISPVLTQGAQDVSVYFPNDIWYRVCPALAIADIQCFQSGLAETTQATTKTIGATLFQMIPVHIRGGAIVPRQGITKFDGTTVLTTVELRQNPFELLVALNAQNAANGMMYWDDGESILPDSNPSSVYYKWTFNYTETSTMGQLSLQIVNKPSQAITVPKLNIIDVLGYTHTADFNSFKLDGRSVQINTQLSSNNVFRKHLIINTPNLIDLTALNTAQQSPSLLTWNHQ
uniref:Glycosyl hydrolase family 31 C-terminal domain-containing protein n=1 Tax=Plectus sambesii TaxID=2011161 RepID=A0A914UHD1_9BILA